MMKWMIHRLIVFVVLVGLGGCTAVSSPEPALEVMATLSTVPESTITAVLTEQPVPQLPGDPLLTPAYPPPQPTFTYPYPGLPPAPGPTRIQPTPTPTIAIVPADGCDLHPSFSRCGGASLTGKLAYFQPDDQLTFLDLDTETAWRSTQTGLRDVDWSPTGNLFLTHDDNHHTFFYQPEGFLFDYYDYWVRWESTGHRLRSGSFIRSADNLTVASIVYVEVETSENGRASTERLAQIEFQDGTGRMEWLVEDPDFYYDSIALLDWAPGTEWVLLGYANGGVATRIVSGHRLKALNVRSGEIVDSGLSTPGIEQIDWHPSEPGLLITTDLRGSDMMGLGALVSWQIMENQVTHPSAQFVRAPVWSPDGRYIAYSAHDLSENMWLTVLDAKTGTAETRARDGEWPAWSRDGSMLFYLEITPGRESTPIRAVGRDEGEPLTVVMGRFPFCPGVCEPRTVFDYTP